MVGHTLFVRSFVDESSSDIVHIVAPFDLHPWRMGGSVMVMDPVPD